MPCSQWSTTVQRLVEGGGGGGDIRRHHIPQIHVLLTVPYLAMHNGRIAVMCLQ